MSAINRIRNNLLSLASAELVTKLMGAVLYILLARYLAPHDFGVYSVAVSFTMVFGLVAGLGIDSYVIKELARAKEKTQAIFNNGVTIKLLGGIVSFVLAVVVSGMMSYDPVARWSIAIFSMTLILSPIINLYDSVFRGFQRMEYCALLSFGRSLITCLIIVLMMVLHESIYAIVFAHVIASLCLVVFCYVAIVRPRFCQFSFAIDRHGAGELIKGGFPFVATGFVYIINAKADVLILSKLGSLESVGIYDAANELFLVLLVIPSLISQVLYPFLAKTFKLHREGLGDILSFSLRILIAVSVPMSLGLIILAPRIIALFYGQKYVQSAIVLQIMGAGLSIVFLRSVLGWVLAAIDKVSLMMWLNVLNLTINVVLSLLLIPRYTYIGAALATISSMIFGTMVVFRVIKHEVGPMKSVFSLCVRPILSAAPMVAFLIAFTQLNLFVLVVVGAIIYSLCFCLIGGLNREEWAVLKSLPSLSAQ